MNRLLAWFQGKKTIIVAVVTVALTGLGFWYGKLTPAQALQLVSFAGVAVGLGSKLQRFLPQILVGLNGLATALADFKAGHRTAGISAIEGAAAQLLPAVETGLHITGDPAHVDTVLQALAAGPPTPPPGAAS